MRRALSHPRVFQLFTRLLGGPAVARLLIEEWVRPQPGERVLDLGCGLAPTLAHLPDDVSYVGVDINADYVAAARQRYGNRGTFVHADVTTVDLASWGEFDHVLVVALLHHLSDVDATQLLQRVARHVRSGGSIVAIDPSLENASLVARVLIASDRGAYMRSRDVYSALLAPYGDMTIAYRSDLLRVPYSHVITRVVVKSDPDAPRAIRSTGSGDVNVASSVEIAATTSD